MSGGLAYVYDPDGTFRARCNTSMVSLEPLAAESEQAQVERDLVAAGKGRKLHRGRHDESIVRDLVERHLRFTGSTVALALLDNWESARARFVKVFPSEYKRALTEMYDAEEKAMPAVPDKSQKAAA
jgi:glutamate synthase domain-containing protein 3